MIVIFDLPTTSSIDMKEANKFRRELKKEGFIMIQFSVYSRYCRNDTEYFKYFRRVKSIAPKGSGEIRIFSLTEKQYSKMYLISSKKKSDEELLSVSPLVIIE